MRLLPASSPSPYRHSLLSQFTPNRVGRSRTKSRGRYEALGQQIGAALQAAGEVKRSLAESNVDIQQARQRFWKDYDAGVRNGPAELAFGRKLLGKDTVLVSLNISEGTQGTTVLEFTALFGKLDGGIPEPAWPFFEDWVNAIRYLLGGDRPGSLVMATPSQLGNALERTRQWYDVYRQWRDWSEFKANGITRPFPTAEAPDEHALAKLRPSRAREWRVASQQVWAPVVGYPLLRCVLRRCGRPGYFPDAVVLLLARESSHDERTAPGRGGSQFAVRVRYLRVRITIYREHRR